MAVTEGLSKCFETMMQTDLASEKLCRKPNILLLWLKILPYTCAKRQKNWGE
jgi:hypothetical protein